MKNTCYRKISSAIGKGMLFFLLFFNATSVVLSISSYIFFWMNDITYYITYQTIYGAGYLLSFMIPAKIIRHSIKKAGYNVCEMDTSWNLSKDLLYIIFAGITLIVSLSYINQILTLPFQYTTIVEELMQTNATSTENYQIVIEFVITCLIPGICEEFLFRGAILSNLTPFGKAKAIIISSFLFAMMHQNVGQIFYAFGAGIILGLVYVETKNIWNCTFLHTMNNAFSLYESILYEKYASNIRGDIVTTLVFSVLFVLGIIAFIYLLKKWYAKNSDDFDDFFEKNNSSSYVYSKIKVEGNENVKGFLRPSMIVFLSVSIVEMLIMLVAAIINGFM